MTAQDQNMSDDIFPRMLAEAIELRGWTQKHLEKRSGISQGAISNYLRGVRQPTVNQVMRLSFALGVPMEWLITGNGSLRGHFSLWLESIVAAAFTQVELLDSIGRDKLKREKVIESIQDVVIRYQALLLTSADNAERMSYLKAFDNSDEVTKLQMLGLTNQDLRTWPGILDAAERLLRLGFETDDSNRGSDS